MGVCRRDPELNLCTDLETSAQETALNGSGERQLHGRVQSYRITSELVLGRSFCGLGYPRLLADRRWAAAGQKVALLAGLEAKQQIGHGAQNLQLLIIEPAMRHKAALHELVTDAPALPVANVSFNQDASCFAVAYEKGFRVYNSDPKELWVSREFDEGGLSRAVMLQRTNYLVLVGGGSRPLYPQTKVILWDDSERRASLTLEFVLPVLNVLITRTRLIVVMRNKVQIYSFSSPPIQLASFDTAENEFGIASCFGNFIAIPATIEGRIQIIDIESELPRITALIRAHKAALRAICLGDGIVASASLTGTIVRLFDTKTCQLLHEYRRGLDKASIYSMHISPFGKLAVLSSKASLHVYDIEGAHNRRHMLKGIPLGKTYFNSEWSSVSVQTHENEVGTLAWTGPDTMVVVWHNLSRWERYQVSPDLKALVMDASKPLDL